MLSIYQEAIRVRALMVTSHYETFFVPFLHPSLSTFFFFFFVSSGKNRVNDYGKFY